ncbi:GATL10 [Symbiodinium sp. CCMP2592]|nr:GATL10 [Symbiodinium sp. CCMP2592]
MVFFGQPPDPAALKNYFPGISAKSFSPASASVCYRESIQKENNARSDAYESEKLRQSQSSSKSTERRLGETLPGQGSISSAYSSRGWKQATSGRWLPPDFPATTPDAGANHAVTEPPRSAQSERPRSRGLPDLHVTDMWRTTSWSDFGPSRLLDGPGAKGANAHDDRVAELVKARCGARQRPRKVTSVSELDFIPRAPWIACTIIGAIFRIYLEIEARFRQAPIFEELVRAHLPDIAVKVVADQALQDRISSHITFRKSSKARKVLASPFNFAPFYLHEYVKEGEESPRRLIYIDTDTVIMGDLGELQDIDLQGHSCASVKYCLQKLHQYVDFEALRELGFTDFDPEACIANRGLLVIDVERWLGQGMTEKIEFWMQKYKDSSKDLWHGGMSQPPWLLAMKDDFLDLGDEWNCNSLGRENMGYSEARVLRETGFDHVAVHKLGAKVDESGAIFPYVVSCSQTGKLLHYNGAVKPWAIHPQLGRRLPVCALPESIPVDEHFAWSAQVKIFCRPVNFVHCMDIWKRYISDETECALRNFDEEWAEEEQIWAANQHDEQEKLDVQKKAKQKERSYKQELDKEEMQAREMGQAVLQKVDELSDAAQQREREADLERLQLEQRDSPVQQ